MKRAIALLLVIVCCFTTTAFAEGKLKVTEKNLIIFDGGSDGYFFAKVENVGDAPAGAGYGNLVIFTDDDEILLTDGYVGTTPYDAILEPGDYLYVSESIWDNALEGATPGDYKFSIPAEEDCAQLTRVPCEATFALNSEDSYDNYIYVTATANEDTPYGAYLVAALHDEAGELLYVVYERLYDVAVPAGSSVSVRLQLDSDMVEYFVENQIVPASVDAMLCYTAE